MKLEQIIRMVDDIKPNAFSDETKTIWLSECEGLVQTEVMLLDPAEIIRYSFEADREAELLAKAPHDKIYWTYLTAMIDFGNGEYSKYQNTMELFNSYFGEYMRWYAGRYRPADGMAAARGYYLSAYGIAVSHGFVGSEEEWLLSLQGERGADGKGFALLGFYETQEALEAAVTDPEPGDAYGIGMAAPYAIRVWDGVGKAWKDAGKLQGEKGDPFTYADFTPEQLEALRGPEGPQGRAFTYADFTAEQLEELTGPVGPIGTTGKEGPAGVSPTVETTEIAGGHRITITDVNGTRSIEVLNGKDGPAGQDGSAGPAGPAGADGVGIMNVLFKSASGSGNTYTIQLTDGRTYDFVAPAGPAGSGGGTGGGADGVGIMSIQLKASDETGNTYTIILTDGSTYDFVAPAGKPGPAGQDGKDGQNGQDGVSVTHSWSGTTLHITSASGTTSVDLRGPAGQDGADGKDGKAFTYADFTPEQLEALRGPAGKDGSDGDTGPAGPNLVSTTTGTNITGLLKGSGGKVAQAVAGTDYEAPGAAAGLLGRTTAVYEADTGYTTYMARGEALYPATESATVAPTVNGAIVWFFE